MSEHVRTFESFGRNLTILQDDVEIGCTVWDSALVFAKYLENTDVFGPLIFKNVNVIELGSGCGLVGIILALLGANVTFTDFSDRSIEILSKNIQENGALPRSKIERLDWRNNDDAKRIVKENGPFDLLVGSDIAYDSNYYNALASTIEIVMPRKPVPGLPCCILAHELRNLKEKEFFTLLRGRYSVEKVSDMALDNVFSSPDIGIFHVNTI